MTPPPTPAGLWFIGQERSGGGGRTRAFLGRPHQPKETPHEDSLPGQGVRLLQGGGTEIPNPNNHARNDDVFID